MATSIVYHFRRARQNCALRFERVTEALYTVLLDFRHARATPLDLCYGRRRLYDAAALRRIYDACRTELVAANGAVPLSLEAVARREVVSERAPDTPPPPASRGRRVLHAPYAR